MFEDLSKNNELRASEVLLASALGIGSESSLVCDADRRTIYCNNDFTRVTGYGIEDMLGRSCDILQGPRTDPETVQEMRRTLDAGLTFNGRILNYRKDGTTFWNELTINPIHDSLGAIIYFVSVQRDVTEHAGSERDHSALPA